MTEPTDALLPCPFCGSQARQSSGGAWFGTGCDGSQHCPAFLRGLTSRTQAEADAHWNRRTPQPTQAQVGAVPLTDEQIEALPMWKRFVGLWPETRREIVRIIESAHGICIKGGQHGESV